MHPMAFGGTKPVGRSSSGLAVVSSFIFGFTVTVLTPVKLFLSCASVRIMRKPFPSNLQCNLVEDTTVIYILIK